MAKLSVAQREEVLERLLIALKNHAERMQGRYKVVPADWVPLNAAIDDLLDDFVEDVKDKPEDDTDEE